MKDDDLGIVWQGRMMMLLEIMKLIGIDQYE
jgi:hypothetical protein